MKITIDTSREFQQRHLGPQESDIPAMLRTIGVDSLEQLMDEALPPHIRYEQPPYEEPGMSEADFLDHLRRIAAQNTLYKSLIGMGYYGTFTPSVIRRNVLENPGWYTQYTPYQAEISQGRLEALLNFQTMVSDLTGMEVANASLLDEATAAAEAMTMCHRLRPRSKKEAHVFLVSDQVFPQTLAVLRNRAKPLNITVKVSARPAEELTDDVYGLLVQFPGAYGRVENMKELFALARENGILITAAADLLSLTLFTPPGEWGADVVVGSTQRFGVPMGFGGPHAAYFATREAYKRQIPGRIIGVSVDRSGAPAYRMALQTREQHIRREKATSNICTAQALLAIMAGFYAVYHGADGLRTIAGRIWYFTDQLAHALQKTGYRLLNGTRFDTLHLETDAETLTRIREKMEAAHINLNYINATQLSLSLDETTTADTVRQLAELFAEAAGKTAPEMRFDPSPQIDLPTGLQRSSDFLTHPVFNRYRSETEMMRYIKSLENKDLSLTASMIPLGSCTMKLNPATAMLPVTWPLFAFLHPFVPPEQAQGYHTLIHEMEKILCAITGFAAISFQPNSGAQGEYTGLSVIRAYHEANGEGHRHVALIPTSAHGTNPASATMAGMRVVLVQCDARGNVDIDDLKAKAETHRETLAAFMITYPSTHGVFEEDIRTMIDIIHQNGGQVYMDGANMNAQVGYTSPGFLGADVCHLNLHKTFSIPHGGGGPGVGPIGVAEHLRAYLPGHPLVPTGGTQALPAVAAAPYGSAGILPISYAYMKMLGSAGMRRASAVAILNANYIKARLEKAYKVLYTGKHGRVAHEMILDFRPYKAHGIEVTDVAKRLMDYSFHAPTVAWPVPGTMMVEPTESESKAELDRFCDAMLAIHKELEAIAEGRADKADNPLKNAPHTLAEISRDDWDKFYSRSEAAFPVPALRQRKFWPPVARIDDTYGDRHLVCSCPPLEHYAE
ncbi:MAG: glycine dehydrogenase (aminomethyl-transferring) [Calditrichaeota bacterium]|nr:MAG: glycine dehydrogenase (aminomethyl-transferring) [Calditrichota bacterium]